MLSVLQLQPLQAQTHEARESAGVSGAIKGTGLIVRNAFECSDSPAITISPLTKKIVIKDNVFDGGGTAVMFKGMQFRSWVPRWLKRLLLHYFLFES
jgi:hypothetical protein